MGPGSDLGQAWSSPPAFLVRYLIRLGCSAPSPLVPPTPTHGHYRGWGCLPKVELHPGSPESQGYQAPTAQLISASG